MRPRQSSDVLKAILALSIATAGRGAKAADDPSYDDYFPRDQYPTLSEAQAETEAPPKSKTGLVGDIKNLSTEITRSVKEVAQKRNFTCFSHPCLLQVFPLAYSKPDSGFFGGFRARLSDISAQNPYLYALDTQVIRSDTAQWIVALNLDLPQINLFDLRARLRLRGTYARSTEFRYSGEGLESFSLDKRPDEDKRFSLNESTAGGTLLLPLFSRRRKEFGLYASYDVSQSYNAPFQAPATSILFTQEPLAYRGGTFMSTGGGFYSDTRRGDPFAREGGMVEFGAKIGLLSGNPREISYRATIVDREYQSSGRWTLAHRLTLDALFGNSPFWEKAAVGGTDPLRDISGSGILKAYAGGRFHENYKFIESVEVRVHENDFSALGAKGALVVMPLAIDTGFLNRLFVWSLATGIDVVWNRSFLTRLDFAYTDRQWGLQLRFSQEF